MPNPRTYYTNPRLSEIRDKLKATLRVLDNVLEHDTTLAEAIRNEHLNETQFRVILDKISKQKPDDTKEGQTLSEQWNNDFALTGMEQLYADIFQIPKKEYRTLILPESAYETYQEIAKALTERERDILNRHYFQNETYKTIGQKYQLTQSYIQRIHQDALQKLRHPTRALQFHKEQYEQKQQETQKITETVRHYLDEQQQTYTDKTKKSIQDFLQTPIQEMQPPTPVEYTLKRAGIRTMEDLIAIDYLRMMSIRQFGLVKLSMLIECCHTYAKNMGLDWNELVAFCYLQKRGNTKEKRR